MYFFHGRNTLNDLVYHSSSYFTRVLFDRDSHSGVRPHVGTDTGSVPTCGLTPELAERGGQTRGDMSLQPE